MRDKKHSDLFESTPCTSVKNRNECAEQGLKVKDMCDNCAKYWTIASEPIGDTPDDAVIIAQMFKAIGTGDFANPMIVRGAEALARRKTSVKGNTSIN